MPAVHRRKLHRRPKRSSAWLDYEEVARHLLNEIASVFGLVRVEGKQVIGSTRSSTSWEIDAVGVTGEPSRFKVVEVRRYERRRLRQEQMAAIAFRVRDTRANGGIVVTPLGLQRGAVKVAKSARVISVRLDANSTVRRYVLRYLKTVRIGVFTESINVSAAFLGGTLTSELSSMTGEAAA